MPPPGVSNLTSGLQPSQTRIRQRSASQDMGDPIAILACKGINKDNKTDIKSLVAVLRSLIPTGGNYNIKKPGADQLTAVCALLDDLQQPNISQDDDSPVTKKQLDDAIQRLSDAICTTSVQHTTVNTYAGAVQRCASNVENARKAPPSEIQEKQVAISMRKVDRNAKASSLSLSELTSFCNSTLTEFFACPENGAITMEAPLRGTSRSQSGNITLTFKKKEDADRARIHEDWTKLIDPQATLLQRMYAVVVHNAPIEIHKDGTSMQENIATIEDQNTETILPYMLSHIAWLNNAEMRSKSRYGPLLLCFKSKEAANKLIDSSVVLDGALCRVSIYIPRPPQCFRCQNWGHRATECTGEAKCGKCAGDHSTADHKCTHSGECSAGPKCKKEQNKCSNCEGEHPSWIRSCPKAKAALEAQSLKAEYSAGHYEASTPPPFTEYSLQALLIGAQRQRSPSDSLQLRIIPATSPVNE
jgi:hypothetical protein